MKSEPLGLRTQEIPIHAARVEKMEHSKELHANGITLGYINYYMIPSTQVSSAKVLFPWIGQPVFQPGCLHMFTTGPSVRPRGARAGMFTIFPFGGFYTNAPGFQLEPGSPGNPLPNLYPLPHHIFLPDRTCDAEGLPSSSKGQASTVHRLKLLTPISAL